MIKDDPAQDSNISIPKELSFPIPKSLKSIDTSSKKTNLENYQKRDSPEHRHFGYFQLKKDVSILEKKQFIVEKNLRFIQQLMLSIEEECKETAKNELCHIIDSNQTFIDEETGEEYPVGELSFIKKELNTQQSYELTVDMSYYFHHQENNDFIEDDDVVTQTIIWSSDENNISTKLFFNDEITTSEISVEYIRKANGEKYMKLKEEYIELYDNTIWTYYLALQKEAEREKYLIDSHYAITFTFDGGGREKALDEAKGFLGEEHGELVFLFSEYKVLVEDDHIISGGKLAGVSSIFDVEGKELSSTECNPYVMCDLNDTATWADRALE